MKILKTNTILINFFELSRIINALEFAENIWVKIILNPTIIDNSDTNS